MGPLSSHLPIFWSFSFSVIVAVIFWIFSFLLFFLCLWYVQDFFPFSFYYYLAFVYHFCSYLLRIVALAIIVSCYCYLFFFLLLFIFFRYWSCYLSWFIMHPFVRLLLGRFLCVFLVFSIGHYLDQTRRLLTLAAFIGFLLGVLRCCSSLTIAGNFFTMSQGTASFM